MQNEVDRLCILFHLKMIFIFFLSHFTGHFLWPHHRHDLAAFLKATLQVSCMSLALLDMEDETAAPS